MIHSLLIVRAKLLYHLLSEADLVNIILKFSQLDTEDHMETIGVFRSATAA